MNCVYTCLFSKMLIRKNSKTLNTAELKKASQPLEDSALVVSGEALTAPDGSHDLEIAMKELAILLDYVVFWPGFL